MENFGFPNHAFATDAAVVVPDEERSFVWWLDLPTDIANELSGRAANLNDATHIAFAAWHIAHDDSYVAVFAPKAHAWWGWTAIREVHFLISFLADLTNVGASNMEQLPQPCGGQDR